jgi:hypothetical protein
MYTYTQGKATTNPEQHVEPDVKQEFSTYEQDHVIRYKQDCPVTFIT